MNIHLLKKELCRNEPQRCKIVDFCDPAKPWLCTSRPTGAQIPSRRKFCPLDWSCSEGCSSISQGSLLNKGKATWRIVDAAFSPALEKNIKQTHLLAFCSGLRLCTSRHPEYCRWSFGACQGLAARSVLYHNDALRGVAKISHFSVLTNEIWDKFPTTQEAQRHKVSPGEKDNKPLWNKSLH